MFYKRKKQNPKGFEIKKSNSFIGCSIEKNELVVQRVFAERVSTSELIKLEI
jgi:hypothetical protein